LKTIFVVDDSDTNLAMAEEALEDTFRVMTMPSAAGMFKLLEKVIPNIIFLDIEMPEVNGFEALEKLKSNHAWKNIPVFFLTGTTDASIEAKGKELGALGIVTKPFTRSSMNDLIDMYLA